MAAYRCRAVAMPRNLPARRLATLVEVTTRVIWHRLRVLPAATALAGIAAGVTIPLAAPGSTLTILVWWAIATGLLGAVESFVQASGVSGRLVAGVISVAFGLFVLGGPVQDLAVLVLSVTLRIEEALGVGPAALRPRGRADVDVEDLAAAERAPTSFASWRAATGPSRATAKPPSASACAPARCATACARSASGAPQRAERVRSGPPEACGPWTSCRPHWVTPAVPTDRIAPVPRHS
jgi:hypothetical protein